MENQECSDEVLYLTQYVLEHFYNNELPLILPYFHRDIVWIGAADGQFLEGYDAVCGQLSRLRDIPRCFLADQEYKIIIRSRELCTVAGHYTGYTMLESREIFSAVQRVTFIWKLDESGSRILHMHVSNPLALEPQDLHFPHTLGKRTYEYMQRLIAAELGQTPPLYFHGKNAETYFFKPDEILYIEASNIYSVIHTMTGCYTVCRSLNRIGDALPDHFIRIHRSFIINRNHVLQINRYKLLVRDGSILPVPEKKYPYVRKALTRGGLTE